MGRMIAVFVLIIALGVAGLFAGRAMGFDGELGIIAAVAAAAACLVAAMDERKKDS